MALTDEAIGKILDAVTVDSPVEDFVATDLEFHRKIAVGSGNTSYCYPRLAVAKSALRLETRQLATSLR